MVTKGAAVDQGCSSGSLLQAGMWAAISTSSGMNTLICGSCCVLSPVGASQPAVVAGWMARGIGVLCMGLAQPNTVAVCSSSMLKLSFLWHCCDVVQTCLRPQPVVWPLWCCFLHGRQVFVVTQCWPGVLLPLTRMHHPLSVLVGFASTPSSGSVAQECQSMFVLLCDFVQRFGVTSLAGS
jgi:hypothetical protein